MEPEKIPGDAHELFRALVEKQWDLVNKRQIKKASKLRDKSKKLQLVIKDKIHHEK